MILLGLATMGTSAAALVRDGELVAAVEEERLTRIKNDGAFPVCAIAECLAIAGVSMAEVDAVAVYWRPFALGQRIRGTLGKALASRAAFGAMARRTVGALVSRETDVFHPEAGGRWSDLFRLRKILTENFGPCRAEIAFYEHHLTHQIYAESVMGWPDCLSLSIDGGGEIDATVLTLVQGGRRRDLKRIRWPNSLGHFYSAFTGYLGFRMLEGEYKMMGLAPYGEPRLKDAILERILRLDGQGGYRLDTRICDYHRALEGDFPAELTALVGPPRHPDETPTEGHLALAASVQAAFEAAQQNLLRWGKAQAPGVERLAISGGCGLNVTANGRVLQAGLFREIIAPPAPHDGGCAVGAALAHLAARGLPRPAGVASPYLGADFPDEGIAAAFDELGLRVPPLVSEEELIAGVVDALVGGGVVAWHQGRTEYGPRALGSRSILADPRHDSIREAINAKIKKRELFRPFAPSTTVEAAPDFFELAQPSPYMNILAAVRPDKRDVIPAVTHVDGTARVHTVSAEANPLYHRLITAFGARTGVPVLLNTSFNIQEPIVNTPSEALWTFRASGMDLLAIGRRLYRRGA